MSNNTIPFFEIVKLIDQVFPSKSELYYSDLTPEDLVKCFDEAVSKSI